MLAEDFFVVSSARKETLEATKNAAIVTPSFLEYCLMNTARTYMVLSQPFILWVGRVKISDLSTGPICLTRYSFPTLIPSEAKCRVPYVLVQC